MGAVQKLPADFLTQCALPIRSVAMAPWLKRVRRRMVERSLEKVAMYNLGLIVPQALNVRRHGPCMHRLS
jgi:hypothetical protein